MAFFDQLIADLHRFFGTTDARKKPPVKSVKIPKKTISVPKVKKMETQNSPFDPRRARDDQGRYLADDPDTEGIDEAWIRESEGGSSR